MTQEKSAVLRQSDEGEGNASAEEAELTKDDLFHVLQNERRRQVLRYIVTNGPGPFEMREIAEQVAAWENDTTQQALTSDQRQRVYIALYQSHLPKLDEHGLIDYNQSRGIVEARPLIDQTVDHLSLPGEGRGVDAADATEDETRESPEDPASRWGQYFGAATAVSVLLLVGAWTNALPVVESGLSVATVVVGMFSALTIGLIGRPG